MELSDLQFEYPSDLIATEKKKPSRLLVTQLSNSKADFSQFDQAEEILSFFKPGDVLVVNNTKVLARRLFAVDSGFELLFLKELAPGDWQVLCPSSQWPKNANLELPEGVTAELIERGRTQIVRVRPAEKLSDAYFAKYADLPLPPYILKTRKEKRARPQDQKDYQTYWAKIPGSLAAPTASLHFSGDFLERLKAKDVRVVEITLHVGLGTFLPITTSLSEHKMHSENVRIPFQAWQTIQEAKRGSKRIWALGTTVTRALESVAAQKINQEPETKDFVGDTDIFIRPGYEFQVVNCLLTNFHQPESTLLALVAAFAGLENVKSAYQLAIQNQFRLFSYGDLSAWIK